MKEKPFIFFNGQIYYDFDDFSFPLNRALLYGESIFTTFLYSCKTPFYLSEHLERTYKGIQFLYGEEHMTVGLREKIWRSLVFSFKGCCYDIDYSFRLTFFLKTSSRSLDQNEKDELCFFIWATPIILPKKELKSTSLSLAQMRRVLNEKPSFLKMGNYGNEIIELRKAKQKGFDDVLFLDNDNKIKECSTSNIIFIKGKRLVTPRVDSCLLDGITRKQFLNFWKSIGGIVTERNVEVEEIERFDTILLTNSVQLIRPCFQLEETKLNKKKVFELSYIKLFQKFYDYSKEKSYKDFINYEKEKNWNYMSSLQEEV